MTPGRPDLPTGTVTFLFTDIEGSTRLLQEVGEARYAEALSEHRRVLRDALAGHGGVEVDTQGDAFFYAFADATEAVAAAAQAQETLSAGPVKVRMGLHTGEPRRTEEGYVGREVHRGARIASAGHGGQVLLSRTTRDLTEVPVADLGEHRLKDFDEPVWIFQLGQDRFPPLKTISNTNLPRPASSFVGREREIGEVSSLLRETRLLTLTGPGGSGKTRLAIEAAAEVVPAFKAGVFWVGLAPLRDPGLVTETVAQTLGARDGLAEHIGEREMLLVLDNFEQVVEAAPELASLVEACPHLRLLLTSRELLRVRGEVEYPVLPLATPEAVELFCARSRLQPDEAITELCRRLDDLPLAVELAAARTSVLSPRQILERLAQRLDLLKGGRDADPRQQTLRATIEWSHDLLSKEEKALFARLSVFAGGCTLEAAHQVAQADLDVLQSLVDKSLLRHTEERFWMLETIREYAAERLEESDEGVEVGGRFAEHFLQLAESSRRSLRGPDQIGWLRRLTLDEANLRAVLAWALEEEQACMALAMAHALEVFWIRARRDTEAEAWLDRVLALDCPERPVFRARALATGGIFAPNHEVAMNRFAESIPVLRRWGDEEGLAFALRGLSWIHRQLGEPDRARAALEEAVELFTKLGHTVTTRLIDLGGIALEGGDLETARDWFERARAAALAEGDLLGAAGVPDSFGELALAGGDLDEAERRYREGLRMHADLEDPTIVDSIAGLAVTAARRGRFAEAGWLWGAAERMVEESDPAVWREAAERLRPRLEQIVAEASDAFERGREPALRVPPDEIKARLLDDPARAGRSSSAPATGGGSS